MTEARFDLIYSNSSLPGSKFPTLICGFPGSGYVGKLAIDHLIHELNASHLADIYSNTFPPQVMIKPDGTVDLIKNAMFYHKTGWYSYWTNDVGIVDDGEVKYIIACFIPLEEELALPKFKILSEKVYELMKNRH